MGKKKTVKRKEKKERKGRNASTKYKMYTVEGGAVKRKRSCPRCGPGIFLGEHQNRFVCGKCGYVEIK